jgi:hypothetical protein
MQRASGRSLALRHGSIVRWTKARAARSYAALRRAAHYPLSLPPYCKAFMASFGVHGHNAPLARNSGQPCEPFVV